MEVILLKGVIPAEARQHRCVPRPMPWVLTKSPNPGSGRNGLMTGPNISPLTTQCPTLAQEVLEADFTVVEADFMEEDFVAAPADFTVAGVEEGINDGTIWQRLHENLFSAIADSYHTFKKHKVDEHENEKGDNNRSL
jgi:hypothetical protein